ncbi:NADH-quinone oxidoreductase subunit N [Telmatocola sphagniphila]|uniref:NADH-quinone oxidoreductase subunit N n=1 Tax=Telmatocola sphagniphila TaxID=1123043 RepID=A0A8E6EU42_9BACT|nr:NADH-quinone oxidoreductase subunit N [Telmatocola sphagniphila]QVL33244.1 NADH-quinone oxidoreductase subunit N [Telmatocola sphagniphila]
MFPNSISFGRLQAGLTADLLWLLPEIILCLAMVLMLFLRLFGPFQKLHMGSIALGAAGATLAACVRHLIEVEPNQVFRRFLFSDLLVLDSLALFGRVVLSAALFLFILLTLLSRVPDKEDSPDFYVMVLGSTLGMFLMSEANHLLTVFIAVEMASIPSYTLSGFFKGNRRASEAALKYVVYGAAASGVMLYGISLLTSIYGTGNLSTISHQWSDQFREGKMPATALAALGLVLVGLAFKLSLVPFHFWLPDVFEGASAEVGGYLSVASKAAAFLLTTRLFILLWGSADSAAHMTLSSSIGPILACIAAATCTLGNLAAFGQTNIKRLLAYSTIAHAGYMFMGLAIYNESGAAAVLFYLPGYLFMNLAAFGAVCFLRNATNSELIADYAGIAKRAPFLVAGFSIAIFGLLGIPPLVGFAAKFQIFAALVETGRSQMVIFPLAGKICYALLIIAAINTILSAAYYLRVLRVMILDDPPVKEHYRKVSPYQSGYVMLAASAVVVLGILWNPLERMSRQATLSPLQEQHHNEMDFFRSGP